MKRTKRTICALLILILLFTSVSAFAADPIAVEKIILSEEELIIPVKGIATLKTEIEPKKPTNKKLAWSSSDEKVATVKNGKVTGISVGTAIIIVTAEDGKGATASVRVTVVQPVKKLIIEGNQNLALPPSCSWKLIVTAEPADATIKDVVWSSSNTRVVTVDDNGVLTAVAKGDAVITAVAADGGKAKASIRVKVQDFDLIFTEKKSQSVTYQYSSGFITIKGSVKTGSVRLSNVDTTILAVIGREVKTEKASVSPIKPGNDVVTISVNGKSFSYSCFVSPEVFPESGLALTAVDDEEETDFLFMEIPWGSTSEKAQAILKTQNKSIKDLREYSGYLRGKGSGIYKIQDYTATNCYLNFAFEEGAKDFETNNTFYEADLYFDKEIPLEQLELAIRTVYGLRQGEPGEDEYTWELDDTFLKLTKKDRFIILTYTKAEQ